jgi:hypothetical protein
MRDESPVDPQSARLARRAPPSAAPLKQNRNSRTADVEK